MKKLSLTYLAAVLLVALTPALSYAMPWSWDMFRQPSHRAQKDIAPNPPEGTVPVTGRPYYMKDRASAVKVKNPAAATSESIERGKLKYETYCLPCHGVLGKGDGPVGVKYVTPTDLSSEYVQNKPDGDIFFTITSGGLAIMPSYGDSVPLEERWHIVNYIKNAFNPKKASKTVSK